jgi:hypothetical protein
VSSVTITQVTPEPLRLCNRTVSKLSVKNKMGRVAIPPLGAVEVLDGEIDRKALGPAVAAGILSIESVQRRGLTWTAVLIPVLVLVTAAWAALYFDFSVLAIVLMAIVVVVLLAVVVGVASKRGGRLRRILELVTQPLARMRESAYAGGVLAIVISVPGAILFFGSDVLELIDIATRSTGAAITPHEATVALIGIGMQELCVVGASALPVLLYFLFDRQKLGTLRNTFLRHVFRLDPSVHTLADVETRYGQLLDEAYGRRGENTLLPGTRSPLLLATAVITFGWTMALLDPNVGQATGAFSLPQLLTPRPNAPTFAFLGAYFFTLNSVLRGYVRGDLRPKTYAHVATRMVCVAVLAFVLEQLARVVGMDVPSAPVLVVAFIAGVVPETILVRLQEVARGFVLSARAKRAVEHFARTYESEPLTQLEGIDIYDRARLLDEGVTNVEALAHHNLVDLLLKTRIPAPRIVDWVDQAILYIHCSADDDGDEAGPGTRPPMLRALRRHGIRTATDLEYAHTASRKRKEEEQFFAIVGRGQPPRLRTVLDALSDEEWMPALRCWRKINDAPHTYRLPEDCVAP